MSGWISCKTFHSISISRWLSQLYFQHSQIQTIGLVGAGWIDLTNRWTGSGLHKQTYNCWRHLLNSVTDWLLLCCLFNLYVYSAGNSLCLWFSLVKGNRTPWPAQFIRKLPISNTWFYIWHYTFDYSQNFSTYLLNLGNFWNVQIEFEP